MKSTTFSAFRKLSCSTQVCALLTLLACFSSWGFEPMDLRCEYRHSPVAIDTARPRLSWAFAADSKARGEVQTAYQILVAVSESLLNKNQADLWDSGQVNSGESLLIAYSGRPLNAGQTCFWKVRVWDAQGRASRWSQPARFGLGPLKPADWKAQWIGSAVGNAEDPNQLPLKRALRLDQCKWVWSSGSRAGNQAPGKVFFRKLVTLPADQKIKQALFLLTADDAFNLFVNGHLAGQGTTWRTAQCPDVTEWLLAPR